MLKPNFEKADGLGMRFTCTECESTFSKQDDLIEHLNIEHEINRQCLICQQVTVYIRTL